MSGIHVYARRQQTSISHAPVQGLTTTHHSQTLYATPQLLHWQLVERDLNARNQCCCRPTGDKMHRGGNNGGCMHTAGKPSTTAARVVNKQRRA